MIDPRDLMRGPLTDAEIIDQDAALLVEEIAAQEGLTDGWAEMDDQGRRFFRALARNPCLLSRPRR